MRILRWSKAVKHQILKAIVFAIIILAGCLLGYGVHYYRNPVETDIGFAAQGILIYKTDPISYEVVDVKVNGKKSCYRYKNELDSIQGNIWLNGKGLFGYGTGHELGFYIEFPKGDEYVVMRGGSGLGTPGCMLTVSRELEPIICGISETKDVPYQALLVFPSETIEAAGRDISDIASKTKPLSEWLSENGWNEIL